MTTGPEWLDSARRLLETLRTATGDPSSPAAAPAGESRDGAAAGGECRWCPLCQAAAVIRGERPEVSAALADILATTADVLRQYAGEPAASPAAPPTGPPAAPPGPAPEDTGAPPRPVQRIELT